MRGLYSVSAVVCGSAVLIALLSNFVTDGGTKKLLRLVMGAFMVCCMVVPTARAISGSSADWESGSSALPGGATVDEAFNRQVTAQTKLNLESALKDILEQNGISIRRAEITLALTDESHVIISDIAVTIGTEQEGERDRITQITETHFTVRPRIITE